MESLKELFERNFSSQRIAANTARISFRAAYEIRSGNWDKEVNEGAKNWSVRKKLASVQVMARIVTACGEDPSTWAQSLDLENKLGLNSREISGAIESAVARTGIQQVSNVPALEEVFTKEDGEILLKTHAVLGSIFTVRMAIDVILKNHSGN